MRRNPLFRFVRARTVQHKFNIIIGLIVFILLYSVVSFWFGIKLMNGIRGYVGGEGLWSKAQKEALSSLVRYAHTGDEAQYDKYQELIKVPEGDKDARHELDRPNPDETLVKAGFIWGGNNPADLDDMIFLYRNFKQISYMHNAIVTWQQGDGEIVKFRKIGDQIHQTVMRQPGTSSKAVTERSVAVAPLLTAAYANDSRLTVLENRFSSTLGLGSRRISDALLRLTVFATVTLGVLTTIVAIMIARTIIKLDRLKTEFVSLASHQLRTPLTAINWYTEALLDGSRGQLSPDQQDYMTELSSGGRRMSNLINDLLKVSSLDLGTYHSEPKDATIDEIAKTVIKDFKMTIDKKKLQLTVNIESDLPKVKLDEQLLTATLQNLLSNSVKYTPNGGKITLDIKRQKENMLIHVGDSGIGIPASQQAQIFTKLFRADNAQQLESEGTGLGLYIVRALAERSDGNVTFTSTEGRGSDFYVTLPIYRGIHVSKRPN